MVKLLPDPQIGGIGGMLLWLFGISLVLVFLFTTGIGPLLLFAAMWGVILLVVYFVLARVLWRAKRGK